MPFSAVVSSGGQPLRGLCFCHIPAVLLRDEIWVALPLLPVFLKQHCLRLSLTADFPLPCFGKLEFFRRSVPGLTGMPLMTETGAGHGGPAGNRLLTDCPGFACLLYPGCSGGNPPALPLYFFPRF